MERYKVGDAVKYTYIGETFVAIIVELKKSSVVIKYGFAKRKTDNIVAQTVEVKYSDIEPLE